MTAIGPPVGPPTDSDSPVTTIGPPMGPPQLRCGSPMGPTIVVTGAMRLLPLSPPDPKAQQREDTVIIVMPMKVLGVFRNYRFSLNIGDVMPGVWEGPYDPYYPYAPYDPY